MFVNVKRDSYGYDVKKLLTDESTTNTELIKKAGFSANITTRIKRDNYIFLNGFEKICKTLHCRGDILEFTLDGTEREKNIGGMQQCRYWESFTRSPSIV